MKQPATLVFVLLLQCLPAFAERKPNSPKDARFVVWGTVEDVIRTETDENNNYKIRIHIENTERGRLRGDITDIWATCYQRKASAPRTPAASGHTAVPKKGQFIRALLLKPRNDEYEGIYPDWFHEVSLNGDQLAAMRWVQTIGSGSHLGCDDRLPGRPVTKMYTFKMWRSGVSDEHMKYAAAFPELRSLDLLYSRVRHDGLKTVSKLKNLEHLSLSGYNSGIGDHDIRPLADCGNLRSLSLMNTAVTDQSMQLLAELPSLRSLNLSGTKVTDAGLARLSKHQNLESLTVHGSGITDRGVQHLATVKSLKRLSLESTAITDNSLKALTALNLTSLELRECGITEAGMIHLGSHKNLTNLGLQSTPATDAVMKALARCKSLRTIVLQKTKVGDEGLMHLTNCPNLKSVWIAGSRITPDGMKKFKQALAMCNVSTLSIE